MTTDFCPECGADSAYVQCACGQKRMHTEVARATPKCGNCRFWRARLEGSREGACHFAPPTPMIIGMSMPAGGGAKLQGIPQQAPQPIIGSQFPPVGADSWCGCHREKINE